VRRNGKKTIANVRPKAGAAFSLKVQRSVQTVKG
jgi:hypothetical protein